MKLRMHIHDGVLSFHPISADMDKGSALYSWLDNLLPDEMMEGDWAVDLDVGVVWNGDDPPQLLALPDEEKP